MQDEAIACAIVAIEKFAEENKITSHIKGVFEKKYSPYWHCICGRNFGAYVTHEAQNYIYLPPFHKSKYRGLRWSKNLF